MKKSRVSHCLDKGFIEQCRGLCLCCSSQSDTGCKVLKEAVKGKHVSRAHTITTAADTIAESVIKMLGQVELRQENRSCRRAPVQRRQKRTLDSGGSSLSSTWKSVIDYLDCGVQTEPIVKPC